MIAVQRLVPLLKPDSDPFIRANPWLPFLRRVLRTSVVNSCSYPKLETRNCSFLFNNIALFQPHHSMSQIPTRLPFPPI
jgi:hypothetical protein